jgi:hypothetical protein
MKIGDDIAVHYTLVDDLTIACVSKCGVFGYLTEIYVEYQLYVAVQQR